MRTGVTVIMIMLAAAAMTIVLLLPAPAERGGAGRGPGALPALAALLGHDVRRITIQRAGGGSLVFERQADGWAQVVPFSWPMDRHSIDQFIAVAATLRALETMPRGDGRPTLAELSLDPPLGTITYEWDGGMLELQLGRPGLAGRAVLRVAGDEAAYVVPHDLHDRALAMDGNEWRDRRLFRGPPGDDPATIETITMAAGEQRVTLRRKRRQWSLLEPARTRADTQAVDELLGAISRAVCGGFIVDQPESLARFALDPPAGSLTIAGATQGEPIGPQQRLLVGAPIGVSGQDRFGLIDGRPVVLRVPAAALAALFRSADSLVDPTACGVFPPDVKTLRIAGPQGEFRLRRDLDRWIAPDHAGAEIPGQLVNEWLNVITTVRGVRIRFEPFPKAAQLGHVTLLGFDDRPLDTVRIARDDATGDWIMDNGDNVQRHYPANVQLRLWPESFGLAAGSAH